MTADDIFLLFAAFGGFVIAPALLLWGFARITHRKQRGTSGPDIRPDVDFVRYLKRRREERSRTIREGKRLPSSAHWEWQRAQSDSP